MKKIVSLALALLMLAPMALNISAGQVYVAPKDKDHDDWYDQKVTGEEFYNLIKYWELINQYEDDGRGYSPYDKYLYGYYNRVPEKCEECGKIGYIYFSDNKATFVCPTSTCKDIDVSDRYIFDDDDDDTVTDYKKLAELAGAVHKKDCKGYFTFDYDYKNEVIKWECKKCGNSGQKPLSRYKYYSCGFGYDWDFDDDDYYYSGIKHSRKDCDYDDIRFGEFTNGKIYWKCDNCGESGIAYTEMWGEKYDIDVYCTKGGTYSIDGLSKAYYGETKTIEFKPSKGYVLSEVTVNGKSYGDDDEITIKVNGDMDIRAYFVKKDAEKEYSITTTVKGGGTVTAKVNGKSVDINKLKVKSGDKVTLQFNVSSSYNIDSVKIDGKSVGKVKSYTFDKGIKGDHTVVVTYSWKNPYTDVDAKYESAVEYVTKSGIMGYFNKAKYGEAFCGKKLISIKALACALAEMADVNNKLSNATDRLAWAKKNGLTKGYDDLGIACDVQTACAIVNDFLALIEDKNDISFDDFDSDDSAKTNAISIGMVSASTYKNNRNLTRYDLAAICRLLANLEH